MDKVYDHNKYEDKIYMLWEASGAFTPKITKKKKPFTIIMPPPNANDPLHVGHAMFVTVEDILIRYHRMKGEPTLWLPGTDHAGIETQYLFEKKLAKQNKSRFDYNRETLYKMIWDYVQKNSGVSVSQMKRLGASADWTRFKFTLEPDIVDFVTNTFVDLYKDDLVYRGEKLINYCTKCGTGYSELEIEYEERKDPFYYIKYGPFTIATTRPETKFRDTALAVNPKDRRYTKYLGQELQIMGLLGPVTMKVVADPEVDPKFGSGIMKVTPAHDHHDFELGERYNLPITPIITKAGRMDFSWFKSTNKKYGERAAKYNGKKVLEARALVVEDLQADGLLVKTDENYVHRVATCYRCHNIIEPLPMKQFFVKVKPLVEKVLKALDNKQIKIYGVGREKILRHWLKNLRDWNISRQIVWGIRIPVWFKGNSEEWVVSKTSPGPGYNQDTDTFDTWFSSGQWPVVTLKTTRPGDFGYFYPTSVMETGYDILPIWVMRMLLLGLYLTNKSPFQKVYLHGLIRDEKGTKMSKSKGNVINPLDMVEKYGSDALRMALVMSSVPGQDKAVGENAIRAMRNFSNKIWNASRYVFAMNAPQKGERDGELSDKLKECVDTLTKRLDQMKIGQAAEYIYAWFWHIFCDNYIELSKKGLLGKKIMLSVLETNLKLLHPFMPFVTEAIWQELSRSREKKGLLINAPWPKV